MAHGHPPTARLRRNADFRHLARDGVAVPGSECVVRRRAQDLGRPRLGIAAPRGYGRAVRRNRFRRLVREAFRLSAGELGSADYLVAPRRTLAEPTLAGIRGDLLRAADRSRERTPTHGPAPATENP